MQTQIPLLQNVRVASPCHADWDGMVSVEGERVKFCTSCSKNVYNLSEMSQSEAESLLLKHEGRLCVRYYRRNDGTILSNDCRVGASAVRLSLMRRSVMAAGLFGLLVASMAGLNSLQTPAPATPSYVPATDAHGNQGAVHQIPIETREVPAITHDRGYIMGGIGRPVTVEMGDVDLSSQERAAENARKAEEALKQPEQMPVRVTVKQLEQEPVRVTVPGAYNATDTSDEAILKDKTR